MSEKYFVLKTGNTLAGVCYTKHPELRVSCTTTYTKASRLNCSFSIMTHIFNLFKISFKNTAA